MPKLAEPLTCARHETDSPIARIENGQRITRPSDGVQRSELGRTRAAPTDRANVRPTRIEDANLRRPGIRDVDLSITISDDRGDLSD